MTPDMAAALLSWAAILGGYPTPIQGPEVVEKPHAFFVKQACNDRECKVLGWYAGENVVYIDDRMNPEHLYDDSIVVHEFVHWLQFQKNGKPNGCEEIVRREREAYAVQREFVTRYGSSVPIGVSMADVRCEP